MLKHTYMLARWECDHLLPSPWCFLKPWLWGIWFVVMTYKMEVYICVHGNLFYCKLFLQNVPSSSIYLHYQQTLTRRCEIAEI